MKLLDVYEDILKYFKMFADKDGRISQFKASKGSEEIIPIEIEGKELWLPTERNLKTLDATRVVFFSPLKEFIDRGQSPVVARLRRNMNIRLNVTVFELMAELTRILMSPKIHAQFTPEQRELVTMARGWEPKLAQKFPLFASRLFKSEPDNAFLNIYLKKAGVYKGEKHSRVGIVTFDLERHTATATKEEVVAYNSLFKFIFPESHEGSEEYNAYSDSMVAPWLECLMNTSRKITERINEIVALYEDWLSAEDLPRWQYDHTWVSDFDQMETIKAELRLMPSLSGNEGEAEIRQPITRTPTVQAETTTGTIDTTLPVPVARPMPEPMYPVASPPQQVLYNQYGQPVDQYGRPLQVAPPPPMMPVVQTPPQSPVRHTADGKLDFDTVLASNPAVGQAAMAVRAQQSAWMPQMAAPQGYQDPRLAPTGYQPMMDPYGRPIPPGYAPPPQMYHDPRLAPAPSPYYQPPAPLPPPPPGYIPPQPAPPMYMGGGYQSSGYQPNTGQNYPTPGYTGLAPV